MTWTRLSFMVKLLRVIDGNIIEEDESQFDVRPFELRRQRIEGVRRANRGHRRRIKRIFSGGSLEIEAFSREAAVAIDAECNRDDTFIPHVSGFGHHSVPILLHPRHQPGNVAIEVNAFGWRQDRDGVADLPSPSPAAAPTPSAASSASWDAPTRAVGSPAGMLDRVLQLIVHGSIR